MFSAPLIVLATPSASVSRRHATHLEHVLYALSHESDANGSSAPRRRSSKLRRDLDATERVDREARPRHDRQPGRPPPSTGAADAYCTSRAPSGRRCPPVISARPPPADKTHAARLSPRRASTASSARIHLARDPSPMGDSPTTASRLLPPHGEDGQAAARDPLSATASTSPIRAARGCWSHDRAPRRCEGESNCCADGARTIRCLSAMRRGRRRAEGLAHALRPTTSRAR